jgi:hypothetical protein
MTLAFPPSRMTAERSLVIEQVHWRDILPRSDQTESGDGYVVLPTRVPYLSIVRRAGAGR